MQAYLLGFQGQSQAFETKSVWKFAFYAQGYSLAFVFFAVYYWAAFHLEAQEKG